ncbi:BTB/POZ domain-containing protein KCTD9 [Sarcoptes scabiei]|uniref:BTB/POZ domain-containing protein KCTD9 n=2 Tax=Sarcoptes scabiei TaxID=52283 RepID=A0A834VIT8_SARSC|nr:BTB/POZ domain-containing protein KCTD9 [Sarcoptes scabiei]
MSGDKKKRVTIFLNHSDSNNSSCYEGKVFAIPDTIEKLLSNVRKKFQLKEKLLNDDDDDDVLRLFTKTGAQIDDVDLIRDDEVLHACWKRSQPNIFRNSNRLIQQNNDSLQITQSCLPNLLNEKMKTCEEWIKLNVGGKIFATTKSTIALKEPDSMLAKMFDGDSSSNNSYSKIFIDKTIMNAADYDAKRFNCSNYQSRKRIGFEPSIKDEQGAYLIDRNPEYFEPLIGYLRHGNLIIDKHLNPLGVLEEAKFYGFYSLIPELETKILQESLLQNTLEKSIGLTPLTRKDVVKAIIRTSSETDLRFQGVNFSGSDLSKLDLSNISFKYAILRGANLQGATLNNCCLERADMSKCNLEGASLVNCRMVCCNLEGSSLRGSNMDSITLDKLTNLEKANLNNVNLEGSKMYRVNLRLASLKNANIQNCGLNRACFSGANLENCDFTGSDLSEAYFQGANIKGARFDLIHTQLQM